MHLVEEPETLTAICGETVTDMEFRTPWQMYGCEECTRVAVEVLVDLYYVDVATGTNIYLPMHRPLGKYAMEQHKRSGR